MNAVNQYSNHNPFHPKQSDGEIMLLALFGGMLLCLGIVVGSNLLNSFLGNEVFRDRVIGCPLGDGQDLEEEKLANTINATYIVSFNELDYVPLEEVPLGSHDGGPRIKTYNQLPADITQEGFVDGNTIIYEPIEVTDVSKYVEECKLTGPVILTSEEDNLILCGEGGCILTRNLYSESAKPYGGEEDFTTNLMNTLNLDNYLNSGEQYRFDVNFTVNSHGYLVDIGVVGTQGYLPSYVKKHIIQKIRTLPKWKPATQNSRSVSTKFKLPIVVNVQ